MATDVPFPLVDILNLELDIPENELRSIGDQIVEGFKKTGYVYLKNHGLSVEDIESFVKATNTFFDLEEETKMKYQRNVADKFHGYSTEKEGRMDPTLPQKAIAMINKYDVQGNSENYPNEEVPEVRQTAKNLLDKIPRTAVRILRCLELGLKIKDGTFVNSHKLMTTGQSYSNLKSARYMPPEKDEQVIRFEPHSDFCMITLQLYADLEGLEFLDKDGVWQKPKLSPGYIVIFPSEIIQMWTGDHIKASVHRVTIPEDEHIRSQPRHAVIFFIQPDDDAVIEPLDGSYKYQPITSRDYFMKNLKLYFKDDFEREFKHP